MPSNQPEKVEAWAKAWQRGLALDLCDRILEVRDVPDRLTRVLGQGKTPVMGVTGPERILTRHRLTRKQQEIVHLLSVGWRGPRIAEALGISIETFKSTTDMAKAVMGAR